MSFARFSEGDLYVYLNVGGLFECCFCSLGPESCVLVPSAAEMVAHLEEHRSVGHDVPGRAFEELRTCAVDLDAYAAGLRASVDAGRQRPGQEGSVRKVQEASRKARPTKPASPAGCYTLSSTCYALCSSPGAPPESRN